MHRANEIYLFTLALCIGIVWVIVEIRNSYLYSEQERIGNKISYYQAQLDSLEQKKLPAEKMKQLVDNLTTMFEKGASDEDGKKYLKDFRDKFEEKEVLGEIKKLNADKINLEKQRQEITSNYIDNTMDKGFTKWFAIIFSMLIYPLRFIYLTVRWAFRTLKQKPTI